MSGPTLGPQFDINDAGERYLADVFAGKWVLRRRGPDVFVDFEVEQRLNGEPTGRTFYLQLKSTANLEKDATYAKVVMETKHLRYYLRVRQPVFIVVVDITAKRGYYTFIQPWLDFRRQELANQESLTILVPLPNELEVHPKFTADVVQAIATMADRFPGTPQAAIASIEKRLEVLDDRFEVHVTATSSGQQTEISAKCPVEVKMLVNQVAVQKWPELQHALDWGKHFHIANVQIEVKGSKLFEHIAGEGPRHLEWEPADKIGCTVTITAKRKGKVTTLLLPATMTPGLKGVRAESDRSASALQVELLLPWPKPNDVTCEATVNLRINTDIWSSRTLFDAPNRQDTINFMHAVYADAAIGLEIRDNIGRFKLPFPAAKNRFGFLKPHCGWFRLLAAATKVAEHYGLNPSIPAPAAITEDDVSELRFAVATLSGSKIIQEAVVVVQPQESLRGDLTDIEKSGTVRRWFRGEFASTVKVFGEEKVIGGAKIGPALCEISIRHKPVANEPFELAVRPFPRGYLEITLTDNLPAQTGFQISTEPFMDDFVIPSDL